MSGAPLLTAPLGPRIAAYTVDLLLVTLGAIGLAVATVLLFSGALARRGGPPIALDETGRFQLNPGASPEAIMTFAIVMLVALLLALLWYHGYFVWLEAHRGGQTLGKRLFRIRVVSHNGSPITVRQATWRDLARYIDVGLLFPGLLMPLMDPEKAGRRLGDRIAGTRVIRAESTPPVP